MRVIPPVAAAEYVRGFRRDMSVVRGNREGRLAVGPIEHRRGVQSNG